MAPLPPAPGVIQVTDVYKYGSDTNVINRLFYQYTGARPTAATCNAIAAHRGTLWVPAILGIMANNVSIQQVIVTDLAGTDGQTGNFSPALSGTGGATNLPASSSVVLSHTIGARYRGGHPRSYLPWGTTSNLADPQTWATSFINTVATQATALFITGMVNTQGGTSVVGLAAVSYYQGSTWAQDQHSNWHRIPTKRSSPLILPVTAVVPRARIGTQRRRVNPG